MTSAESVKSRRWLGNNVRSRAASGRSTNGGEPPDKQLVIDSLSGRRARNQFGALVATQVANRVLVAFGSCQRVSRKISFT